MIEILSKSYCSATEKICNLLCSDLLEYNLHVCATDADVRTNLQNLQRAQCVVMIGDIGDCATNFAQVHGLSMYYDNYAQKILQDYCALCNLPLPPQYAIDKLCLLPETFIHYSAVYGYACASSGHVGGTKVYILPSNADECAHVYANYMQKDLAKLDDVVKYCYKLYGFAEQDLQQQLSALFNPAIALVTVKTKHLDSKVQICFGKRCSAGVVKKALLEFQQRYAPYIYANTDVSLPQLAVQTLRGINKTVATAESITGGLIASSIVDVPGASMVLYEGVVAYSVAAKCKRIGLSPHFVDEYGVVSSQVAQEMAVGMLKHGADVAVATTGFAGLTAENGMPVGLTFVGVASQKGVSVFKYVFSGDRNSIRHQAKNGALFQLIKHITQ